MPLALRPTQFSLLGLLLLVTLAACWLGFAANSPGAAVAGVCFVLLPLLALTLAEAGMQRKFTWLLWVACLLLFSGPCLFTLLAGWLW